jgi:tight adherence protein B
MRYLTDQLEASGLSRFSAAQLLVSLGVAGLLVASWVQLSFAVLGLTVSAFFATIGFALEALNIRAKQRSDQLAKLWPELIDSLQSAGTSGIGMVEALAEIGRAGPERLRPTFSNLVARIDAGEGFEDSLDWLKSQFGQRHADQLIELLRLVHVLGGAGYLAALRSQAAQIRNELALWGELESKQGWVQGTAKLALTAPWIIVATLAARGENVAIYNSTEGITILFIGLAVSVFAYRLISMLGTLNRPRRVFVS